ncbi:MAG: hypothetical protein JXR77_02425 [Lentisphaeria bacterium]|nr:hypothetical protein [Lentisphaeria bacterium]
MWPWLLPAIPMAWLWLAAATVMVEPYDGYDTICNARYFAGEAPFYITNRGPLLALLLVPCRLLARGLDLHPLDPRPYHAVTALLHSILLGGVFLILRRRHACGIAGMMAFAGAMLCFVFFSYAPFLSHDLLPGGMLLGMLLLERRYSRGRSRAAAWTGLCALGATAALLKPTLGVLWVCVLAAAAPDALADRRGTWSPGRAAWCGLAAGAFLSAMVYWLVMGVVLGGTYRETALWLRPWEQLVELGGQYSGKGVRFPLWVYVRNLPFYGLLTSAMVPVGLALGWRRGGTGRSTALAWVAGFVAMHIPGMREVRYIAFLMPVSALLCAEALEWVLQRRNGRVLAGILLGFDALVAGREALRLTDPFYRHNPAMELLEVLGSPEARPSPVYLYRILSFMPHRNSPFAGDRYHRLFHLGVHHVHILFDYQRGQVRQVRELGELAGMAASQPRSVILLARNSFVNPPGWVPGPPRWSEGYRMVAGRARELAGGLHPGEEATVDGVRVALSAATRDGAQVYRLHGGGLDSLLAAHAFPCLVPSPSLAAVSLQRIGNDCWQATVGEGVGADGPLGGMALWAYQVVAMAVPAIGGPGVEIVHLADASPGGRLPQQPQQTGDPP